MHTMSCVLWQDINGCVSDVCVLLLGHAFCASLPQQDERPKKHKLTTSFRSHEQHWNGFATGG